MNNYVLAIKNLPLITVATLKTDITKSRNAKLIFKLIGKGLYLSCRSTVANNEVTLTEAGSQLISYFVGGSVPTNEFITALYVNGAPFVNENIVQSNSAGAASKTIIYNASAGDTHALYNTSATEATLSSAAITV